MKLTIETKALRAAAICAPKKDQRYYLNGVYIEAKHLSRATVASTNGSVLFAGRAAIEFVGLPVVFTMIIPIDVIKAIDKKSKIVTLESLENGMYCLGSTIFKPIDGVYPDIYRVMPAASCFTTETALPGSFNYDLVVLGNTALSIYYDKKDFNFPLEQRGTSSAVMHYGMNDAIVVVMPLVAAKLQGHFVGFNNDFPDEINTEVL